MKSKGALERSVPDRQHDVVTLSLLQQVMHLEIILLSSNINQKSLIFALLTLS